MSSAAWAAVGGERLIEAVEDLGHVQARLPFAVARLVVVEEVEREEPLLQPELHLVGGGRRRRGRLVLGGGHQRSEQGKEEHQGCGWASHKRADSNRVPGGVPRPGGALIRRYPTDPTDPSDRSD
ncbi:MAG: hypothetical protein DMF53_16595 [Acidobacteria bacterium]|nr:MAG: hypothetical protein DMF53_16595 [Acidobacteriota bacterium]